MRSFTNRVAAITGAGSGIGRALAHNLANAGCHLALSDINEERVRETAEELTDSGVRVTHTRLDVADRDAFFGWARDVEEEHGQVNLIFNNAGVALSTTAANVSHDDFQWIMNINFWGVVHGTQAFLPAIERAGEGHVINISSLFGLITTPAMSAYNASKFAVRGYTEALRQELDLGGKPISATCVHPGGIKTNIARDARMDSTIEGFIVESKEKGRSDFEKLFITTPDAAARTILKAVKRNQRRVLVGPDAQALDLVQRAFPQSYQRIVTTMTRLRSS